MSKLLLKGLIVVGTFLLILLLALLKQNGVLRIVSIFGVAIFAIARVAWKAVDKEDETNPPSNSFMKDYYQILEVEHNATQDEIKTSFRRLSKKWHPDKNPGRDTTLKMQELIEAYEILQNPEKRARYDARFFTEENKNTDNKQRARANNFHGAEEDLNFQEDIRQAQQVAQSWLEEFLNEFKKRGTRVKRETWSEAKSQGLQLVIIIVFLHLLGLLGLLLRG